MKHYLHEHIPPSQVIQVQVRKAELGEVRLSAPLAPNINHRRTAFGGSAGTLATLAAWALVYLWLRATDFDGGIVIQHNEVAYVRPIIDEFMVTCYAPPPDA